MCVFFYAGAFPFGFRRFQTWIFSVPSDAIAHWGPRLCCILFECVCSDGNFVWQVTRGRYLLLFPVWFFGSVPRPSLSEHFNVRGTYRRSTVHQLLYPVAVRFTTTVRSFQKWGSFLTHEIMDSAVYQLPESAAITQPYSIDCYFVSIIEILTGFELCFKFNAYLSLSKYSLVYRTWDLHAEPMIFLR